MKLAFFFLFFALCFTAPSHSASNISAPHAQTISAENSPVTFEDLTIVISSCGKYADCWKPMCGLLFKYWPSLKTHNRHVPVVLITSDKDFEYEGVRVFKIAQDKGWSDNMLETLKTIKTKYILYLQEDYMLSKPVKEERLFELLSTMKKGEAVYVETNIPNNDSVFKDCPPHSTLSQVVVKTKHHAYRNALQSALWDKDTFEYLLRPGEDPWKFESNGSVRSEGMREPFLAVVNNPPIEFVNACNLGFWSGGSLEFLEKEGFPVKNSTLPEVKDYPITLWIRDHSAKFPWIYKNWLWLLSLVDSKFRKTAPSTGEIKKDIEKRKLASSEKA